MLKHAHTLATLLLVAACGSSQAPLVGSLVPSYSVDFGDVLIGQPGQRTVALVNGSTTTFHLTAVDPSTDPQFVAGVSAGTPIPAQGELTLPVTFTPTANGPQSGNIVLQTDDPAVPQITLELKGAGVSAGCPTISPTALDFGNVEVGTTVARVVTLTNGTNLDCQVTPGMLQGPQAAIFALDQMAAFTVPVGGLVELNVSYSPTAPSAMDTASFTLTSSNSGTAATVDIKGGAVTNCLQFAPSPLFFAFVLPAASRTLPLHLTNACGTAIDVTSVSLADAGVPSAFSLASQAWTGGVIDPGIGVDLGVTFAPPAVGAYTGEVDMVTGGAATVQAALSGFGGGAAISCAPLTLDFGTTAVGIPTSLPVICTNTGTDVPGHPEAGLVITTLTSSNPLFSGSVTQSQPIPAGKSLPVDAIYTPTATTSTADTGTLSINSNATDGTEVPPPTVALSGQSIVEQPCVYTVTPLSVEFGAIPPGGQATESFALSNIGVSECLVSGLGLGVGSDAVFTLPGGAIVSQRLSPLTTPPGPYPTQLVVNVQFAPLLEGSYSGSVQFSISDPTAPHQSVELSGSLGNFCFALQPVLLDFGTVGMSNGQFCGSGKRQLVGVNGCQQAVTIQSATMNGGMNWEFISTDTPQTVAPGGTSTPFVVGFKPESAGSYTAGILVQTDLQASPFGAQLAGRAVDGNQQTDVFAGGPAAFPLSGTPDPSSIVVYVDGPPPGQGGMTGVEIPATEPNGAVNWTYDAVANLLVPDPLNLMLATTDTLYVEYTLVCN